jgi:hypothetical protein
METPGGNRNYNTISPSAKWVLLMKGLTTIPYARQTAELIVEPEKFIPDFNNTDIMYWGRVLHFENRYWSIDHLLEDLPLRNILELSAGYSFRGLDLVQRKNYHYIDTDLPDMITQKKELIKRLDKDNKAKKGQLEMLPLNVVDEKQFHEVINHFSPGEIAIVNEGLLVYLNQNEKEKLCGIIRRVLKEKGGYWITGDIYLKLASRNIDLNLDEKKKKFFEEHHVEENRFESFKAAEKFFNRMGFIIDKEAALDLSKYTAFPYLIKYAKPTELEKLKAVGNIHTSWRLKLADE